MSRQNTAYDLSLFEPQQKELPRELSNAIELPSQQLGENRRPRRKSLGLVATFCFTVLVTSALGTLACGQVQLTELTEQLSPAIEQMKEQKSLHTQPKMGSDSRTTLQMTEVYAKDQLGMSKATYTQVECVKLPPGDKGQVFGPDAAGNWRTFTQNSLQNLLS